MKLIIQIPCYNEESTLPAVLREIPTAIPGVDQIETIVIDDGSSDRTGEIARAMGAASVVRNTSNVGLARTFKRGLNECLRRGADIIVNIDGDNQYKGADIPRLIAPILEGRADIVIGDRQTHAIQHFSPVKRILQALGSSIVRYLAGIKVNDAVSGFRAFSRDAAFKLTILSNYTYTIESILQARTKGLCIAEVPIATNYVERESRLMRSIPSYIMFSTATIVRIFTMYNPLRVFIYLGTIFIAIGLAAGVRFLLAYYRDGGAGHIQSVVFGVGCVIIGMMIILVGLIADLIQFNRRLAEDTLEKVKRIELERGRVNG